MTVEWISPPGSFSALEQGCLCAVMDNHRGAGRWGDGDKYGWYITVGCPLHAPGDQAN